MKEIGKRAVIGFFRRHALVCGVLALLINLITESLSRGSLFNGVQSMFVSPKIFIYNFLLIFAAFTVASLFQHRLFVISIITIGWLTLGITNGVLLTFRATPFSAGDFFMMKTALTMIDVYLSVPQIVCIVLAFLIAGVLLWLLHRKLPKEQVRLIPALLRVGSSALTVLILTVVFIKSGVLSTQFANLTDAYLEYGFNYCFACSAFDRGISEPDEYSPRSVDEIREAILSEEEETPQVKPNIIFLQLESFFDINEVEGLSCTENPVPYFEELKEKFSSGYLTVPTIGAGTANTEFEILTGMSRSFFGAGEYPYKTILQESTCETIAYDLAKEGYNCQAMHNNDGTFYDRNTVFSQMGFDSFVSLEYMDNVTYNDLGWAKDEVLEGEIMKSLTDTPEQDFLYVISVQGHGKYPDEPVGDVSIKVSGVDEELVAAYEYYIKQISEMDEFLKELTSQLQSYDEPVMLVMYGDHLPSLSLTDEDVINKNLYQTEYVIWTNYQTEVVDKDLYSYQLSANVLESLNMNNGMLTRFHNRCSEKADYLTELEILEYDVLYGDKLLYNGTNPYTATALQMGNKEININDCTRRLTTDSEGEENYALLVNGDGFNEWSSICINGKYIETEYISDTLLQAFNERPREGDLITVGQAGTDEFILSETNAITWEVAKMDQEPADFFDIAELLFRKLVDGNQF